MKKFLAFAIGLLLLGCSTTRDQVLDTENIENQLEQLSKSTDITPEEHGLLTRYIARVDEVPEGMTVGKAIADQQDLETNAERQKEEAQKAEDRAKAEKEKRVKEMNEAVTVSLISKGFETDSYNIFKWITFEIGFENNTEKEVAGVKGQISFLDIFGDTILDLQLSYDEGIPPKSIKIWEGSLDYNEFMNEHVKLKTTPQEKLTVEWTPEAVVFIDGTSITASD